MKRIKSSLVLLLVFTLFFGIAACGNSVPKETSITPAAEMTAKPETSPSQATMNTEKRSETASPDTDSTGEDVAPHSNILVAFFSATGTTKGVAERIANVTGGDLYEILAAEPYTQDDLNYHDRSSRSTKEQNDKNARPEIGSEDISLEGYTTVFLGFPIWWGEEPRILDTFVEKYNFEGITVIPFCSGNVSEEDLRVWINGLNLAG